MNKVVLIGRLVRDPDIRYTQGNNSMAVTKFTLAVDRKFKRENEPKADFINCTAFAKIAEVIEKHVTKGVKIAVTGRIQTGSFTNKDGQKVYTTDVVVEELDFCERKNASGGNDGGYGNNYQPASSPPPSSAIGDGFMQIPDNLEDEGLPFN